MPDDPSHRSIHWSWIIWACIAIGLVMIASVQLRVNRELEAGRIAYEAAENHRLVLNQATGAAIQRYIQTHSYGDPQKPTLKQFCKNMNGGRPIGDDGIYRDPVTGGEVEVFSFADREFKRNLPGMRDRGEK